MYNTPRVTFPRGILVLEERRNLVYVFNKRGKGTGRGGGDVQPYERWE